MSVKVIIGAGYGDEGKGRMTDYFANSSAIVIRFNGGAQAGHTVTIAGHPLVSSDKTHVFHHFGSGSFRGAATYLSKFFIVNPILFFKELKELRGKDVEPKVFIDKDCMVTTPYDMMLNEIIERHRGKAKHGSCGFGINETVTRDATIPIRLTDDDPLYKLRLIKNEYIKSRLESLGINLSKDYDDVVKAMNDERVFVRYIEEFRALLQYVTTADTMKSLIRSRDIIFEGAQGLMLDQNYPFFPYVTRSNTGIKNVTELMIDLDIKQEPEIVYVTRCYATRHGAGPFPGEVKELRGYPVDETNVRNPFQGDLRYGVLDLDILRNSIQTDLLDAPLKYTKSLAITCLDQFDWVKFTVSNQKRTVEKHPFVSMLARHLGIASVYTCFGKPRAFTTHLTIDVEKKPWFVTESLCELCGLRQVGCPFQYDGDECREKRYHFLNNPSLASDQKAV